MGSTVAGTAVAWTTLPELAGRIRVPTYDRAAMSVGIMHLGVGGFHRSHQAMYLDRLMASGRDLDWALCGVGVLPHDLRIVEALNGQDGLYTLVIKHPDGRLEPLVIGSITGMMYLHYDRRAVVEAMAAASVRIVSLTITEGGYLIDPVTGEFDNRRPSIQPDLHPGAEPETAFGVITAALALLMKLRMLNAGHQVVCYLGALAGFGTAMMCVRIRPSGPSSTRSWPPRQPRRCRRCPGSTSMTIAAHWLNGSQTPTSATSWRGYVPTPDRIPKFLLPSVRHNLAHGGPIERSALVIAAWARYAEGVDDAGQLIEVVD